MIKVIIFAVSLIILNKLTGIHTQSDYIDIEIQEALKIIK
jgi:hypothetical protein